MKPLTAKGLRRRFGEVRALDGLTLELSEGQIYGLVGPDGAGKTTAIRILAGVMGADEGEALFLGAPPLTASAELRSRLGYMPQQYSLYGDLSVAENLRFFAQMHALPKKAFLARRERLLEITRLAPFTERRADALSGGMYKKLALACSLLAEPKVLLLDEPTNGVDPVSRRELWALLFEFAAEGMAVLVSTAYMDEAARCHRVGLIHEGRLLVEGSPERLLAEFEHPTFRVEAEDLAPIELALLDAPEVLTQSMGGAGLRVVVRRGEEAALRARAKAMKAELVADRPDFEDLFLATLRTAA